MIALGPMDSKRRSSHGNSLDIMIKFRGLILLASLGHYIIQGLSDLKRNAMSILIGTLLRATPLMLQLLARSIVYQ